MRCADVVGASRGAVRVIGNLLVCGFGAGASGKVSDCEWHVKVGVQSSAFVRLSRFGREQMGVPIATLPLQEDARASLKEVFVVEAVRVWRRRSARSKQGERWTRGDP